MFALVNKSDNSITKMLSGSRGITIDGVQHPRAIYTLWTEAERNALDIYTVEMDYSKIKDEELRFKTKTVFCITKSNIINYKLLFLIRY